MEKVTIDKESSDLGILMESKNTSSNLNQCDCSECDCSCPDDTHMCFPQCPH